jgi:hypothetical protein
MYIGLNPMASQEQVRNFLAYWFQLGKPVVLAGGKSECLPSPVYYKNRFSLAFEDCWQQIMATHGENCYLKGTVQTIAMMLTPAWDMTACARCNMPVPVPTAGMMTLPCPCSDLQSWPNQDLPMPRIAVDDSHYLDNIQQRLDKVKNQHIDHPRDPYDASEPTSTFSSWRGMS